jgi:hypothetical protein
MAQGKGQQVQNGDRGAKLSPVFSKFVGPSKESVFFSKSSLNNSYRYCVEL